MEEDVAEEVEMPLVEVVAWLEQFWLPDLFSFEGLREASLQEFAQLVQELVYELKKKIKVIFISIIRLFEIFQ